MFKESTQIIKQHGKSCFVDVRASFGLGEGKVSFNFRSLDQNNKVKSKIDCYLSIEEFHLLAHMFKSGSILSYLQQHGRFVSYGGFRDKNGAIKSRQFRVEGNQNGLYIKGLQGPGKVTPQGGYSPDYKDNEAETILIKVDVYTAQMMGFAFERAISYYDEWNKRGVLEQKMEMLRQKEQEAAHGSKVTQMPTRPNQQPAYNQPNYTQPMYNQPVYSQPAQVASPF